jgi:hypothetical protein
MRPPKPDFLVQWEKWLAMGPPRCCHTCDHFGGQGECFEFKLIPPPEFVAMQDCCPVYSRECPF